jgi:hypothetical protein
MIDPFLKKDKNKMHTQKRIVAWITLILVLALGNLLRAQGADTPSANTGLDLAGLKKELAVFQGVIDTTIKENLQGPFPVLGSTRGTYLPDYGAVFNLEVNAYLIRQPSPFDMKPHSQKELDDAYEKMMSRIQNVKGLIIKAIAEHGNSINQLKPGENLTVVVYLFSARGDERRPSPSQIVLNVKRYVLQQYQERKISMEDLKQNIRTIQY